MRNVLDNICRNYSYGPSDLHNGVGRYDDQAHRAERYLREIKPKGVKPQESARRRRGNRQTGLTGHKLACSKD